MSPAAVRIVLGIATAPLAVGIFWLYIYGEQYWLSDMGYGSVAHAYLASGLVIQATWVWL
jgi:hypothetical protein